MDLKEFSEEIPINLQKHQEVTFWCKRPQIDEYEPAGAIRSRAEQTDFRRMRDQLGRVGDGSGEAFPCNKANKKKLLQNSMQPSCISVADKLVRQVLEEVEAELGN